MNEIYLRWLDLCHWLEHFCKGHEVDFDEAYSSAASIPPANVSPVVLCEQCRYSIKIDEYEIWCNGFCSPQRLVRPDDFCSHGKEQP